MDPLPQSYRYQKDGKTTGLQLVNVVQDFLLKYKDEHICESLMVQKLLQVEEIIYLLVLESESCLKFSMKNFLKDFNPLIEEANNCLDFFRDKNGCSIDQLNRNITEFVSIYNGRPNRKGIVEEELQLSTLHVILTSKREEVLRVLLLFDKQIMEQ